MLIKLINTLTLWGTGVLLVACGQQQESGAPGTTAGTAVSMPTSVVRIGHVGPITGAVAHLGKDNENGALMAIEELNAQGVSIHGQRVTLELLAEDDAADPMQATLVAQKLVDAKVAGVVGHLNSGTTMPASKLYSDAGIPQLSPSATNPRYTRQGFKTTFRLVADDAQLGKTLGKYAVGTLKAKAIAVIDDRTAYGQGLADEFSKAVVSAGGKIVRKDFTTDKATDFNAILTAIKAKKPDLVFFGGMDAVAGPMLRQMKSLGIRAKFMGGDGICSTELLKLAGDAIADDWVFCAEAGGVEGEARAELDAFKARFKTKYGTDIQVYAPYVYDAVKIMVAAMVKAESADSAKYLPVLAATSHYKGVTGSITFDGKGDIKNGAVTLKTIRLGRFETLAVIR
jgi:branched-chain amino acid transport system substrate-binding protein